MTCDVFCYGGIGIDNIVHVPYLPSPERFAVPTRDAYQLGGGAVHTATWLATWGLSVRISGNPIGYDPDGDRVMEWLARYPQIDLSAIERLERKTTPFVRCLVTPDGDRSMLAYWYFDTPWTKVTPQSLGGARYFSVNLYGAPERHEGIETASQAGLKTIVADIIDPDHPSLPFIHYVINSAGVMRDVLPGVDLLNHMRLLQLVTRLPVIVTDGARDVLLLDQDGSLLKATPPTIEAVDATGSGDSFVAGVMYGLLHGWSLERTACWACATGALQALRGSADMPSEFEAVEKMAERVQVSRSG